MTAPLIERLAIKSGVMQMGEPIAWGSDTALMDEAAAELTRLTGELALADREIRAGRHLHETARQLGWLDDGEGAQEYVMRQCYEQGREDTSAAHMTESLTAAVRAAELALFVIRKQGVMPNSSWEAGFESDMNVARAALEA